MWWKLGVLGLLAVALIALLVRPIPTAPIMVDLPPPNGPPSVNQRDGLAIAAAHLLAALYVAALALIGWLMWKVVRYHRATKDRE